MDRPVLVAGSPARHHARVVAAANENPGGLLACPGIGDVETLSPPLVIPPPHRRRQERRNDEEASRRRGPGLDQRIQKAAVPAAAVGRASSRQGVPETHRGGIPPGGETRLRRGGSRRNNTKGRRRTGTTSSERPGPGDSGPAKTSRQESGRVVASEARERRWFATKTKPKRIRCHCYGSRGYQRYGKYESGWQRCRQCQWVFGNGFAPKEEEEEEKAEEEKEIDTLPARLATCSFSSRSEQGVTDLNRIHTKNIEKYIHC
mmetsp:Transcript_5347/g.11252  ORF Transcript_5347/g.11252 Transcript_5347/m.11252 type:complete len:261 (+) Transcript_5347:349-1131(+)